MTQRIGTRSSYVICLALIASVFAVNAQAQKSRKAKQKPAEETQVDEPIAGSQVQLKLKDGTRINAEDAWESEQGDLVPAGWHDASGFA